MWVKQPRLSWRAGLVALLGTVLMMVGSAYNGQADPGCEVYSCYDYQDGPTTRLLHASGYYNDWWRLEGHIVCYHPVFWYKLCENSGYEESYTGGYLFLTVPCTPAGDLAVCYTNCSCSIVVK